MLVEIIGATMPLGQEIGIFTLVSYGILTVAGLLLPEIKGRGTESGFIETVGGQGWTKPSCTLRR